MSIKGVIFDMDGLMFDTERLSCKYMVEVLNSYSYEIPEEILKKTIGINRQKCIEIFKDYFGKDFPAEEVLQIKRNLIDEYFKHNDIPIKKGLLELLDYLEENKIKKAVATSSHRVVAENILKRTGVFNKIDEIVCGDEIVNSKPDPEIFLKTLDKLCLNKDEVIVLEDSKMGIIASHKADIKVIMIPDILPADEEIKKLYFKEFKSLLDVMDFLKDIK